ncbi:hypothetical protein ABZP36_002600 [Zizania latifolia]
MLMIERLQREKAAALMEARQFRRLAEGRAERDRELQDELASLAALTASYLSLLHAHGMDPDDDSGDETKPKVVHRVEHMDAEEDGENRYSCGGGSDTDLKDTVVVQASPSPPPPDKAFQYTADVRCAAATVAEDCTVDISDNLYARVEALEEDRTAMRMEVAVLRAERAQTVLAREVARRLCREAVAAERSVLATAEKPRFSVLAICKAKCWAPKAWERIAMLIWVFGSTRKKANLRGEEEESRGKLSWLASSYQYHLREITSRF